MKHINIFTLVEFFNNFNESECKDFFGIYGIELKEREAQDLVKLVQSLDSISKNKRIFEMFYVGYKIPQIGKEFDLIKIGESSIVNIELKSESNVEKIKKQLLRNKYYMNHISKNVFFFTYESRGSKLFMLSPEDNLEEVELCKLIEVLNEQKVLSTEHPDQYFEPTRYLVSPFNSTEKFLGGEYFLTNQQEDIKKKIIKSIQSSSGHQFIAISGNAGTGKTLLTYNIAKELKNTKKVIIIHCANLNEGQEQLNSNGWQIVSIKDFWRSLDEFVKGNEVLIVDEAQRLGKEQLTKIAAAVKSNNNTCLFSYDQRQTLSNKEASVNIEQYLQGINAEKKFMLTEKIRSNESVANLIMSIFDLKYPKRTIKDRDNLELLYFSDHKKASEYVSSISRSEWKVLGLTPSRYSNDSHEYGYTSQFSVSHRVIGQEFDNVAVIIDENFDYSENSLVYRGRSYYGAVKMLFQNMTRTRKKIKLLFVNNRRVFREAVNLMKNE